MTYITQNLPAWDYDTFPGITHDEMMAHVVATPDPNIRLKMLMRWHESEGSVWGDDIYRSDDEAEDKVWFALEKIGLVREVWPSQFVPGIKTPKQEEAWCEENGNDAYFLVIE